MWASQCLLAGVALLALALAGCARPRPSPAAPEPLPPAPAGDLRGACPPALVDRYRHEPPAPAATVPGGDLEGAAEPVRQALGAALDDVGTCRYVFTRHHLQPHGEVQLQVALDTHGIPLDVCILEETTGVWTARCVREAVGRVLFPPGAAPMTFRWRLRFEE